MANPIDNDFILIPCMENKDKKFPSIENCYFEIENKPFRIYTVFFIGTESKLKSHLKRKENIELTGLEREEPNTFSGITIPCTTEDGHSFVIIWLPKFEWKLDDFETLSHECLHATIMVMRMSGVKSKIFSAEDNENCDDEGVCYSQSSMFRGILSELIKRQTKLISKKINKTKKK